LNIKLKGFVKLLAKEKKGQHNQPRGGRRGCYVHFGGKELKTRFIQVERGE